MNTFDLDLKEIQIQQEKMLRGVEEILEILKSADPKADATKEYYTIEECAAMKGGAALNTYKTSRFMLPGCGNPKYSVTILGRLAFPRDEVLKWLKVTDADYLGYARECGVPVVPEKYRRMAEKAMEKLNGGKKAV